MTDVHLPHELEAELDRTLAGLARAEGFELTSHVLDAVGICKSCSETPRPTPPAATGSVS